MCFYGYTVLISVLIWAVIFFLFGHSYDYWRWDCTTKKRVYLKEDKLTAPVWFYLLVVLSIFIPLTNIILVMIALIWIIGAYISKEWYFHIELPEQLKFLTKEY